MGERAWGGTPSRIDWAELAPERRCLFLARLLEHLPQARPEDIGLLPTAANRLLLTALREGTKERDAVCGI